MNERDVITRINRITGLLLRMDSDRVDRISPTPWESFGYQIQDSNGLFIGDMSMSHDPSGEAEYVAETVNLVSDLSQLLPVLLTLVHSATEFRVSDFRLYEISGDRWKVEHLHRDVPDSEFLSLEEALAYVKERDMISDMDTDQQDIVYTTETSTPKLYEETIIMPQVDFFRVKGSSEWRKSRYIREPRANAVWLVCNIDDLIKVDHGMMPTSEATRERIKSLRRKVADYLIPF